MAAVTLEALFQKLFLFFAEVVNDFKNHKSELLGGKTAKKLQRGSKSNAIGSEQKVKEQLPFGK